MRKIISFITMLTMVSGLFACQEAPEKTNSEPTQMAPQQKIMVYYFHFTRRCMTCQNVEKVSKEAVESYFAAQVKSGDVSFQSVNLDEKQGEAIGKKNNVEEQALVVISGNQRIDLTDKGFMYANNSPEKLKAEIKKAVEGMLK